MNFWTSHADAYMHPSKDLRVRVYCATTSEVREGKKWGNSTLYDPFSGYFTHLEV
jgi:hypothetical protein